MKTRIILVLVTALCCIPANAVSKKKAKKNNKAVVEKVDTVSVDTFSYALGVENTPGLMQYLVSQKGVDTTYIADFVKGFYSEEFTEADKREKARLAGIEIRQQVERNIYPNIVKAVNDSTDILNKAFFVQGFVAGITGNHTLQVDSTKELVKKQMEYYRKVNTERKYGANRIAGEEFLKKNLKDKAVKQTESGLQYKVIRHGNGEKPLATDKVKVHYEGRLIDGTEFDSSYKRNRPTTFPVNQVIKGWTEALELMTVGSKWQLFIPQELAYGDREQDKIKPYSCLVFTVELLEIVK